MVALGLTEDQRTESIEILTKILANQHILYQKFRNYHWNIVGRDFFTLHVFFEECYTQLFEDIDVIAERIRSLDALAPGTFTEFLKESDLSEPSEVTDAHAMVEDLLLDSEAVIQGLRSSAGRLGQLGDSGNEDILIGMMETHEKQAWKMRSYLA